MRDCNTKEDREYISKIEKECRRTTNMTDSEAFNFAYRCCQLGYSKQATPTNVEIPVANISNQTCKTTCGIETLKLMPTNEELKKKINEIIGKLDEMTQRI